MCFIGIVFVVIVYHAVRAAVLVKEWFAAMLKHLEKGWKDERQLTLALVHVGFSVECPWSREALRLAYP